MPTIKIDGEDYNSDDLSDEAKQHLHSLHFVETELARLQGQISVFQTARVSYGNALKAVLPAPASETIKFS